MTSSTIGHQSARLTSLPNICMDMTVVFGGCGTSLKSIRLHRVQLCNVVHLGFSPKPSHSSITSSLSFLSLTACCCLTTSCRDNRRKVLYILSHFETNCMNLRHIVHLSYHDAFRRSHFPKRITSLPHQQKCHKWLAAKNENIELINTLGGSSNDQS